MTSNEHCGRCDNVCTSGTQCSAGVCGCGGSRGWCGDMCIELRSNRNHCGACGVACPAESVGCRDGVCVCPAARSTLCGAACVDTRVDLAHCGACGRACAGTCLSGVCVQRTKFPAPGDRLGTRRPTFRWEGDSDATVDVCVDPGCTHVVASFTGAAARGVTATTDLSPGGYFWRVYPVGRDPREGRRGGPFRIDRRSTHTIGLLPPAPDLNGDGLADVVVSARGAVVVHFGARNPSEMAPGRVLVGANDTEAERLALVGDVLLEEELDAAVETSRGWKLILASSDPEGLSVRDVADFYAAPVLDLNDDGAPDWVEMRESSLIAYGTLSSAERPGRWSTIVLPGRIERAAPAGDVNGDGRPDVLLTAPGRGWVGLGASTGVDRYLALPPAPRTTDFGASLSSAGDVNGDGFADALVGLGVTSAVVYLGGRDALSLHRVIDAPSGHEILVAAAGDVDDDGYGDVVAVPRASGEVWIYRGSAAGLVTLPAVTRNPRWLAVETIGLPGDRDGDGFDDVVAGAPAADTVYVFFGASSGPFSRVVALPGKAGSDTGRYVL